MVQEPAAENIPVAVTCRVLDFTEQAASTRAMAELATTGRLWRALEDRHFACSRRLPSAA